VEGTEPAPLFKDAIEEWFRLYVQVEHSDSPQTQHIYRWAIDSHLIPEFANKRLDEIPRKSVATFIGRKLAGGLSKSAVRNIIAPMRGMFSYFISDTNRPFRLDGNPCVKQGQFKKETSAKVAAQKFTIPSADKIHEFLNTCRTISHKLFVFVAVGLFVGLRRGEMLALKWDAVDYRSQVIIVKRTLTRFKTEKVPKSHAFRSVPMPDQLVTILKEWQTAQKAAWSGKGKPVPELVFASEVGSYLNEPRFRNTKFYPARKKCGLTRFRIHDLRHTYASYMLARRTPPAKLQQWMGHHSIQVTVDLYGHMIPEEQHSYVNSMAEGILPVETGTKKARKPQGLTYGNQATANS
jgi:integrase